MTTETTLPRMTIDSETVKNLRQAASKVTWWTEHRNQLIVDAVAAGYSLREVGTAAGMSHTAVKFIAHGRPQ